MWMPSCVKMISDRREDIEQYMPEDEVTSSWLTFSFKRVFNRLTAGFGGLGTRDLGVLQSGVREISLYGTEIWEVWEIPDQNGYILLDKLFMFCTALSSDHITRETKKQTAEEEGEVLEYESPSSN